MLEQLTASYCSITTMNQLTACPSLKEFDISFNSMTSLEALLTVIKTNSMLKSLRFNDNPFSNNKEG
jgi:Leucine-rich repeat (LRR) protein